MARRTRVKCGRGSLQGNQYVDVDGDGGDEDDDEHDNCQNTMLLFSVQNLFKTENVKQRE